MHLTFRLQSTTDIHSIAKVFLIPQRRLRPSLRPGCLLWPPGLTVKGKIVETKFKPLLLHQERKKEEAFELCGTAAHCQETTHSRATSGTTYFLPWHSLCTYKLTSQSVACLTFLSVHQKQNKTGKYSPKVLTWRFCSSPASNPVRKSPAMTEQVIRSLKYLLCLGPALPLDPKKGQMVSACGQPVSFSSDHNGISPSPIDSV